jgi:hypothetical protein
MRMKTLALVSIGLLVAAHVAITLMHSVLSPLLAAFGN